MARETLQKALDTVESKFESARVQVERSEAHIRSLRVRCGRAERDKHRPFRYILRMRIVTALEVRNTLFEYACVTREQVDELQAQLATL